MQIVAGSDDERRRIIEAAYRCLSDSHREPVTMSTILHTAGVSSRAFYRHFRSKDDLFLALLQEGADEIAARVDRVAAAEIGSPVDQLATWIGEIFDLMVDPRRRMQMAVIDSEEVRSAAGYRDMRERSHASRERSLADILRRGRATGAFPLADPDHDAVAISALVSRILSSVAPEDVQAVKQAESRLLDFALRAVGAVARE
ncbi:TetR/AcrR family transcriptional regulator [Mycolicibacterium obuense]|uniref:HTH-type transcriptional regulator BetI n=1 Tax=Mycolicibacterium obuense TaxID=1807 RepID=A0A0J6W6E7_9MYCO|nr:TetR/AcrR family transcriptional regulator [Mycolicibacterium obuense]KMO77403.1 HTH-type transcriptional regulator BetI [Mycolicibacterium obuense]